ncbi:gag-pol polyprotein [Tanacetum coccineum]
MLFIAQLNTIEKIRASTDAAIKNQGASIKALEIQIGQISKVLQERGSRSLPCSTETNPRDRVKSISTSEEAETPSIHQYSDDVKEVSKELEKLQADSTEFALADLGASVSVVTYSTFTNLGSGKLALTKLIIELADKTMKRPKGIVENVLVGIDKFIFVVDFIVLDMPEDTQIPFILRRPFLSTAYAKINVFKRKITLRVGNDKIVFKSNSPTSIIIQKVYALGLRERMELDLEAILMGEALILNRSEYHEFGYFIELNDLTEPLELRNHEIKDLGPTIEEGKIIDEPKAYIVKTRNDDIIIEDIDEYLIVENMDVYRDKYMGDVFVGKPFCWGACVEARRFDGLITIQNSNDSVTYQMARTHPRFKHLSNEQCNKIRPILKVRARDELEGKSHPFQKLKEFFKGVLNLGPKYIRDEKKVECITRGHVSIYEMD